MVLSFISRLFDPLGFLAPFVMIAKCLFQDLWRQGLQWNELVPLDFRNTFLSWLDGIDNLQKWRIPRSYSGGRWSDIVDVQLHAFGDASKVAYGACVKLSDGHWVSSLVFAKGKVAPLKQVTLPRLELLAAVVCARLLIYVKDALKLPPSVSYSCWTDSTVTLAWIKGDPKRWKPFVSNRILEIQSLTSPAHWYHCPGTQNPADIISRGMSAGQLVESSLWLHGPEYLQAPDNVVDIKVSSRDPRTDIGGSDLNSEERVESSCVMLSVKDRLDLSYHLCDGVVL